MSISRRQFLGVSGVGFGALAAHIYVPKRVFADVPQSGRVKRVLILHAGGGMRSSCLFNAHVAPQWNPYGAVSSSDLDADGAPLLAAAEWGVGGVLVGDKKPIALAQWGGAKLPLVSQIADKISVVGAVDHDPTASQGDGNHYSATVRMCGGAPDAPAGLLTMISRQLDGQSPLPPTIVGGSGPLGASVYGIGSGDFSQYRALFLNGPSDFRYPRDGSAGGDPDWVKGLESRLDDGIVRARPNALLGRIQSFLGIKQAGLSYGAVLAHPALRLAYAPAEALGVTTDGKPLTSQMLMEPFGVAPAMGAPPAGYVVDTMWGGPTALGVRLLQLGAPVVAVGVGGWDFHSDEDKGLPPLAASLGRALSALYFTLSRIADADGKSYWDTTLIAVTSEFGRDNTSATADDGLSIGYNRGNGSDHHGTSPSRYQALPFTGGAIVGGRLFAPTDEACNPQDHAVASPSLLATMMGSIGVDPSTYLQAPMMMELFK
ncbi:MAG: hypothetical protein JWN44_1322 [Myxococcales bacterium]|nr:hypothetical protein [Myxococcales bacterium]